MSQRKRVLFLCQEFYPEQVGTGKSMTELAEVFVDQGIEVEVVCAQPTIVDRDQRIESYMEYKGIRIRRIRSSRFSPTNTRGKTVNSLTFTVSAALSLLADSGDCPVLVATTPPFLLYAATLAKLLRRRPYIVRVGDVYPETGINLGVFEENSAPVRVWDALNRWSYRHADKVIVLGRCMRDAINDRTGGAFADKLTRIHVWGDDHVILGAEAGAKTLEERWDLQDKFVVLYSGNMGRSHDIETIIEAAREMRDDPDVVFLMVCGGYKKPMAVERAKKYGLTNVRFEDYVPREEYPWLLQLSDVGITCLMEGQQGLSVPSKSYSLMAAGLPLLALMPASAEIARVAVEDDCGLVVRPGDVQGFVAAVNELKDNPERRAALAENAARACREKYSLDIAARAYRRLLEPYWV